FFFSSRRRHTRFSRDWSSDVCSSDLRALAERILALLSPLAGRYGVAGAVFALAVEEFFEPPLRVVVVGPTERTTGLRAAALALRSEERRVGTEWRAGG